MDRPTCQTCPYWDEDVDGHGASICRRFPPTIQVEISGPEFAEAGHYPVTQPYEWCGEHPDFPAYIAGLKATPEQQETIPLEIMIDDERLGLPLRVAWLLQAGGINTLKDLVLAKEEDILALHQMGPTRLKVIKTCLIRLGLKLADSPRADFPAYIAGLKALPPGPPPEAAAAANEAR